jgi:hypothetical protein
MPNPLHPFSKEEIEKRAHAWFLKFEPHKYISPAEVHDKEVAAYKAATLETLAILKPTIEEMRGKLEKIAKHEGMCMMGPDSETRDEMIAFSNGDYGTLVHKVFELGSHRAYGELAREAKEALALLSELATRAEGGGA